MSFETRYKHALDEVRAMKPDTAEIRETIERFASKHNVGRSYFFAKVGGLAAVAMIAIATLILTPTKASALERMTQAWASVPASHSVFYYFEDRTTQEFWREGVKRRYRFQGEGKVVIDRCYDGKNVWAVFPHQKMVTISEEAPDGFGLQSTSVDEAIKAINASDLAKPLDVKTVEGELRGEKRIVVTLEGQRKDGHIFRHVFYCRASDGLPTTFESYTMIDGKPRKGGRADIDYPADLDDRVFELRAPDAYRFCDLRLVKRMILDGIAGRGPSQIVAGVKVNLLGAFRQSDGVVFVLWCGGATPHIDGKASATNKAGKNLHIGMPFRVEDGAIAAPLRDVPPGRNAPKLDIFSRIAPFARVEGVPIYAMQIDARPSKDRDTLQIRIPAFEQGAVRTLAYGQTGQTFKSDGRYVGSAGFKVTMMPIQFMMSFILTLDKNPSNGWATAPLNE